MCSQAVMPNAQSKFCNCLPRRKWHKSVQERCRVGSRMFVTVNAKCLYTSLFWTSYVIPTHIFCHTTVLISKDYKVFRLPSAAKHEAYQTIICVWCDFYRASSLICGNKIPTRCNRGFYCRSYCLLNMFRAPLCPSSGAQEYYTVVAACGIWWCKDVKSNM